MTIVFADLSGSTSMQERLDAEATTRVMARVQRALAAAIEANGGRVVKSTGDGLMAVFGVPMLREDDAVRAVRAGVALQAAFAALGLEGVALRVGVNTGEVVVSPDSYDVVGDPVNVAARLEAAAGLGEVYVGPETQRLVRDVIALEQVEPLTLKGKADPVPAARVVGITDDAVSAETPFRGREDDMATLLALLDDAAAAGVARLATIIGWPGLGKSRLAAEVGAAVAERATVLEVRFLADAGTSFGPIADALRRAVDLSTLDVGADGERVGSTIAALLAGGSAGSTEQVFWAIRRALEGLATQRPVVVLLDDLQWAEPAMLDLVEHLAEWIRAAPVLLLVLARPELRDRRPALLDAAGPSSTVLMLSGLDADACRQLALDVLGAEDLPPGVLERSLEASEGNPLFLRELLRLLVDDGVLRRDDEGRWTLTVELDAIELPATIHAALAARIEQLRPDERTVLQAASVIGRHFARGAVTALLPPGVAAGLDEHLASLHRRSLVDPEGTWWEDERMYRFHHILIRDAAYRRVLKQVRADQHVSYADWLASRVGDASSEHDEVLGYHLEQALSYRRELGEPVAPELVERAVGHLAAAGRRALDGDDLANASVLLGRALALSPGDPDLLRARCEALVSSGDVHAAASAVADLAAAADDEWSRAVADVFDAQLTGQRTPESLREVAARAAAAAAVLAEHGDDVGVAHAESVNASALAGLGQVAACEAALDRSLASARRAGDARRANVVLSLAPAAALWGPSPIARASGRCLDVVRVLRITSWAPHVEAHALRHQAVLEAMRDRADAARRMLESARSTFADLGHRLGLLETAVCEGIVELLADDPAAAEPPLRRAVDGFTALGVRARLAQATALLARTLLELDRLDEAEELSDPTLAGDDLKASIGLLGVAAEVSGRHGDVEEALALAREAVARAEVTDALVDHADARLALARVLEAAGRRAEAAAELGRARELYQAKGATVGVRRTALGSGPASTQIAVTGADGRPPRRVHRNLAVRNAERWVQAWHSGDWDALESLHAESWVTGAHRLDSLDSPTGPIPETRVNVQEPGVTVEQEILAAVGDRHCLFRRLWRHPQSGDRGAFEMHNATVCRVDESGVVVRTDVFEGDDLARAQACLVQRWAEDELAGEEQRRALGSLVSFSVCETINVRDWETHAATLAEDVTIVDHRGAGHEVHGRASAVEWVQALVESADRLRTTILDVLALSPDAGLWRWETSGERDGGAFSLPTYIAFRVGHDGPFDRLEFFSPDHLDDAWRCFEALEGGSGMRRKVAPNLATEVARRRSALMLDDRMDETRALFSPDFVLTDHRLLADLPAEAHVTSLVSVRPLVDHVEPLAALGARHALMRTTQEWSTNAGSVAEIETLNVIRADGDGRYLRLDSFDHASLASALRCLVERWAEDELAGSERDLQLRRAETFVMLDAASQGDSAFYRSRLAHGAVVADHRLERVGEVHGADAVTSWMGVLEASGGAVVADILALTEDGRSIIEMQATGKSRAAAFETRTLVVTTCGRSGLADRFDVFALEQWDLAWACFERSVTEPASPRRPVAPNHATRGFERWAEAARAGDVAGAIAAYVSGAEYHHHVLQATMSGEELQVGARRVIEQGGFDIEIDPIATLGSRHALVGLRMTWPGLDGGPSALSYVEVCRAGPAGIERIDVFGEGELAAAGACLLERWAEDELSGVARQRALRMAEVWSIDEVIRRRDWDHFVQLFEDDVVLVDHRGNGIESRGPEALADWLRELIAPTESFETDVADVLALTADAELWVRHTLGTANGGEFSWLSFNVVHFGPTGLIDRLEFFSPDDADAAWACFDELHAPGADTSSVRRRISPNRASRVIDGWAAAVLVGDEAGSQAMRAPDFVYEDHELRLTFDLEEQRWRQGRRPPSDLEIEVVATLGDCHSLHRFAVVHDGDGRIPPIRFDLLLVNRVDGDDRIVRTDAFPSARLADALSCLVTRWAEGEAPAWARERGRRTAEAWDAYRCINDRDWDGHRRLLAVDAVLVDHRPASAGEVAGADAVVEWLANLFEQVESGQLTVSDVVTQTPDGSVVRTATAGTLRGGGSFELETLLVAVMDNDGLIRRLDLYPADRVDDALACFDRLTSPGDRGSWRVRRNAACATRDLMATALRAGDVDALMATKADGYVMVDHRTQITFTRDEHRERITGLGRADVEQKLVATLGERYALHRTRIGWRDPGGGGAIDFDMLAVSSVDASGLVLREDNFEIENITAAALCLVERWAEDEAPADERRRALGLAELWRARRHATETGDFEPLRHLYREDVVFTDHGPGGPALRGADELIAWQRSLHTEADAADVRAVDVFAITAGVSMMRVRIGGVHDGGAFASDRINVTRIDDDGRVATIDSFLPEQLDKAWDCFGAAVATDQPAPPPQTRTRALVDSIALEMQPLVVGRVDGDGRADHFYVFEPEQTEAALAQLDERATPDEPPPGTRRRVQPNLATVVYERWADQARSGDAAARSELAAPGYVRFDHELPAELPGRRDDPPAAGYRIADANFEPLASLGDQHALCRMIVVWRDPDGEEIRIDRLAVTRVEDEGRVLRDDLFGPDRLWDAVRCLLERWAEVEASESDRHRAERTARCFQFPVWHREHDWEHMGEAFVDDAVLVDHRPASAGSCGGRGAIVDYFRHFASAVDGVATELLDLLAFTPDGALARMRTVGAVGGAPFEWESLTVTRVAPDGRFDRIEMFPPEALDEAWLRFDRLQPDRAGSTSPAPGDPGQSDVASARRGVDPANVAWRNVQRWAAAVRDGGLEAALAGYPEGYQMVRHDQHVIEDAESWREVEEAISGGRVSIEPVVTLGDRHVLSRVAIGWERDGADVGMETLIVAHAGPDGRTIREDVFPGDRLDLAMGGLVERWAEDELAAPEREVALARAALWRDVSATYGDWGRYAAHYAADAVLVDHRPSGAGEIVGTKAITDWSRALVSLVDRITTRPADVLAVTPGGLSICLQVASGESADGPFEIPTYVVVSNGEDALIDRIEFFGVDQLDDAWACFDRVAASMPPSNSPSAPSKREPAPSTCPPVRSTSTPPRSPLPY